MRRNNLFKQYFNFSKNETRGVIAMLCLIILLYIIPMCIPIRNVTANRDPILEKQILDLFEREDSNSIKVDDNLQPSDIKMFVFDPNKIDSISWRQLGLSNKTTHTILNYRNKGGWFKDTGDIRKIWSIKKEDADRLIPFISIEEKIYPKYPKPEWLKKKDVIPALNSVDLNSVEADKLQAIPGMEYPLPYTIISYKEKLGGYLYIEQVKEAKGMQDSIFTKIKKYLTISNVTIHKLNINTATDDDLSQHPYIIRNIAKAIFIYRLQHGNYKKIEDIKNIPFIKEDAFKKIAPYLSVTD